MPDIHCICHSQHDMKTIPDHAATAWMTMRQLHDHLNSCPFSLVLHDHAATAWMIMKQLHDHTATSLINPFVYKAWLGMCSVVTASINYAGLDQCYTPHIQQWPSAGNNCHWLDDPKATICRPKCLCPAWAEKYQGSHHATRPFSPMTLLRVRMKFGPVPIDLITRVM